MRCKQIDFPSAVWAQARSGSRQLLIGRMTPMMRRLRLPVLGFTTLKMKASIDDDLPSIIELSEAAGEPFPSWWIRTADFTG